MSVDKDFGEVSIQCEEFGGQVVLAAGEWEQVKVKKNFRGAPAESSGTQTQAEQTKEGMSDKTTKRKPRGGLYASILEDQENEPKAKKVKTPKAPKVKKKKPKSEKKGTGIPRKDKIMEHSVCSVVRRMGAEGITMTHAEAILKTYDVTMTTKSLRVQLWMGKAGTKPAAEITNAQVKELKERATDPKLEEAKEEKAA